MWTKFPNRKVFDLLSSYLKRGGGEQLKYWPGPSNVGRHGDAHDLCTHATLQATCLLSKIFAVEYDIISITLILSWDVEGKVCNIARFAYKAWHIWQYRS